MEQQALRDELRKRLGHSLPSELNTDFTLDRWLDNYNNKLDECVDKFHDYLLNRKALSYDQPESLDQFYSRLDVIDFHKIFSLSKLNSEWVNDLDNGIVFVETGVAEPSKNFIEYINPMAAINRMFQARVNIWMDYYGELLKHVIIVNPPRLLGAFFTLLSVLLPSRLLGRFTFAHKHPEDIEHIISTKTIPLAYGGQKVFDGVDILDNGCYSQKKITKNEYLAEGLVWQTFSSISYEDHVIKVGSSYCREMDARKGQTLCYQYSSNREYQIFLIKDKREYLLPCFKLSTPALSEEGSIPIKEDCQLRLEIKNISGVMKMKLKIALHLFD